MDSVKLFHGRAKPGYFIQHDSRSAVVPNGFLPSSLPSTSSCEFTPSASTSGLGNHTASETSKDNSILSSNNFDPKIVMCESLSKEEIEVEIIDRRENNQAPLSDLSLSHAGMNNSFPQNISDLLMDFSSMKPSNMNLFTNTVWSHDNEKLNQNNDIQMASSTPLVVSSAAKTNCVQRQPSFPEVDKCIPKWEKVFPWVVWEPTIKKILCSVCQNVLQCTNPEGIVDVFEVSHPDDVFKVAKFLRAHSEKFTHKMAFILQNRSIISILYNLLIFHFSEFNSLSEILTAFNDILDDENSNISQDTIECVIVMLGQYLEDRILSSLMKCEKFSIITDPCSGILIVRYLDSDNSPREHIISSYVNTTDRTPLQHLSSLGINVSKLAFYISNARCEDCVRCKFTTKVSLSKHSSSLRLPHLDRYLMFLWRTKVLKPFYSLGLTLIKLWSLFPHKFTNVKKVVSRENLLKFASSPDVFIEIFQHFDEFKEIAKSIYKLSGNLEAFSIVSIDTSLFSWLIDIFPILTNINIMLLEIMVTYPFSKDFDNLFLCVEKLLRVCDRFKGELKMKTNCNITSVDIEDLYKIVSMSVKEFQQPIYHKGKSIKLAVSRLSSVKNLRAFSSNSLVQNNFNILYVAIKDHLSAATNDNASVLHDLTRFLSTHNDCNKRNACDVLEYFERNPHLKSSYRKVFDYYCLLGLFAFEPARIERCPYDVKVYDYLFYRSAWSSIGSVKHHVLTILSELCKKNSLSERDIHEWWQEKVNCRSV